MRHFFFYHWHTSMSLGENNKIVAGRSLVCTSAEYLPVPNAQLSIVEGGIIFGLILISKLGLVH